MQRRRGRDHLPRRLSRRHHDAMWARSRTPTAAGARWPSPATAPNRRRTAATSAAPPELQLWTFCGLPVCFGLDTGWNHTFGECWLRRLEDPAKPTLGSAAPTASSTGPNGAPRKACTTSTILAAEPGWSCPPTHVPWTSGSINVKADLTRKWQTSGGWGNMRQHELDADGKPIEESCTRNQGQKATRRCSATRAERTYYVCKRSTAHRRLVHRNLRRRRNQREPAKVLRSRVYRQWSSARRRPRRSFARWSSASARASAAAGLGRRRRRLRRLRRALRLGEFGLAARDILRVSVGSGRHRPLRLAAARASAAACAASSSACAFAAAARCGPCRTPRAPPPISRAPAASSPRAPNCRRRDARAQIATWRGCRPTRRRPTRRAASPCRRARRRSASAKRRRAPLLRVAEQVAAETK